MKSLRTLSPYHLITLLLFLPAVLWAQPEEALPREDFPQEEAWEKEPEPSRVFSNKVFPQIGKEEEDFPGIEVSTPSFETGMKEELELGTEIFDESILSREKKTSFPADEELERQLGTGTAKEAVSVPKGWKPAGKVAGGSEMAWAGDSVEIACKDIWLFDLGQELTALRSLGSSRARRIAYLRVTEISAKGKVTAEVIEAFEAVEKGDWIELGRK